MVFALSGLQIWEVLQFLENDEAFPDASREQTLVNSVDPFDDAGVFVEFSKRLAEFVVHGGPQHLVHA